jgi:DNA-binding MarR family transcriptional regulator
MNTLPTPTPQGTSPAEYVEISPEALEVANCYLQTQDVREVSEQLGISVGLVTDILARREVKGYIDHVFLDSGFNNKYKMRRAMDAIIAKKFQEMEEANTGTNKDILEVLALSHKMTMDQLDRQIQLEKLRSERAAPKNQVNVQVNNASPQSNYEQLLSKLMQPRS